MTSSTGARVDVGSWISQGWALFAAHWQTWVKMGAVVVAPTVLAMIPLGVGYVGMIASVVGAAVPQYQYDAMGNLYMTNVASLGPPIWAIIVLVVGFACLLVGSVVSMYLSIGMWKSALRVVRGGAPSLSDFKGNGSLFGRVFLASLVVGLLTAVAALFCYVPAFIVQGLFVFTVPLLIDRNLNIGDAMRMSREATQPQLVLFIVYAFVVGLLSSLGAYVCLVGLVASLPLFFTCIAVGYRATFESPPPATAVAAG